MEAKKSSEMLVTIYQSLDQYPEEAGSRFLRNTTLPQCHPEGGKGKLVTT
jgi:hypothetical protein